MADSRAFLRPVLTASTLGAPGESLDEVLASLDATGVRALELRLSAGQIADPAMGPAAAAALRARLDDHGVVLTGLASYVAVASDERDDVVVGALGGAMVLAAALGTTSVRVFPGAPMVEAPVDRPPTLSGNREAIDARAAARLSAVAPLARELGVVPMLETHDSHPRGVDVAGILSRVDGPVGAVWDVMHPWRVGEPLEATWSALEPWLTNGAGSVQVKDSAFPDLVPVPVGEGAVPVDRFASILIGEGYSGPICLEWERTWHPQAAPLKVGLASAQRWLNLHWDCVSLENQ